MSKFNCVSGNGSTSEAGGSIAASTANGMVCLRSEWRQRNSLLDDVRVCLTPRDAAALGRELLAMAEDMGGE